MNKEELNIIIDSLESSNSKDAAYLAIHQYGGGIDESYARANKAGLELLAAQLLKASSVFEDVINEETSKVIALDFQEDWLEGDIFIQYVEPIVKKANQVTNLNNYNETIFDKLIPFGCIGIIITFLFSAVIGLATIFEWIF